MSPTGSTSPVAEVMWLTKTTRVRAVRAANSASTTSSGRAIGSGTSART